MTKEEFNNIVKTPSKSLLDEYSIEVERNRFASKKWREWVIHDLNYMGNAVHSNRSGDAYLRKLYTSNVFTDKEWDVLLPDIFYRDYNKDFDQLAEKVIPLFNRIREFWSDLHLEIWQGIFSFGTHWCTEGKSPKESINSPENENYTVILYWRSIPYLRSLQINGIIIIPYLGSVKQQVQVCIEDYYTNNRIGSFTMLKV